MQSVCPAATASPSSTNGAEPGAGALDAARGERLLAGGAVADRAQERLGLLTEEREQQQLLLARRKPLSLVAQCLQIDRGLLLGRVAPQLDRARERRVDRGRCAA